MKLLSPGTMGQPVDELRTGLALATHDELAALAEILFRPKFNPLDYVVYSRHPRWYKVAIATHCIEQIESRVRYLAADGLTVSYDQRHSSAQLSDKFCYS